MTRRMVMMLMMMNDKPVNVIKFGATHNGNNVVRKFQYGVSMYFDVGDLSTDEYLYNLSGERSVI